MSRGRKEPPWLVMRVTRSGVEEGLREVAITWWPELRTCWARAAPKPEEQPVISQTGVEIFGVA